MITRIKQFIKDNKKVLTGILCTLLVLLLQWYIAGQGKHVQEQQGSSEPAVIKLNTDVALEPKLSAEDNDLEIKQRYVAEVNGRKLEVPIVTTDAPFGSKATVTQEIDMTSVIDTVKHMQKEIDKKEFKKNWELGVGIGTHKGDVYIPLELQRNYTTDKAISVEIHVEPKVDKPSINGAEIKYKRLF